MDKLPEWLLVVLARFGWHQLVCCLRGVATHTVLWPTAGHATRLHVAQVTMGVLHAEPWGHPCHICASSLLTVVKPHRLRT
jgi:hypothetical protein